MGSYLIITDYSLATYISAHEQTINFCKAHFTLRMEIRKMNIIKSFSRRSFFWLFILMALLAAVITVSIYLGAGYIFALVPLEQLRNAALERPMLQAGMEEAWPLIEWVRTLFLPVSIGVFLFFFLVFWLAVRGILVRVLRREGFADQAKKGKSEKARDKDKSKFIPLPEDAAPTVSLQEIEDRQKRYYLQLLAVLQREGRLVDFLTENLDAYDDAQIGAAVRSIHENCKKSLEKHLAPRSVMEENEGETVTVPDNFDSSAIKLTGNVTGNPPFNGILRHRGWRAGKLELPVLTGSGDPKIISPAEVEIV